ncbi:XdhC family protein [Xanthomonas axonopodis]
MLVTVATTWRSSPRPVGSMMVLREDGRCIGSVFWGWVMCFKGSSEASVPWQQPDAVLRAKTCVHRRHTGSTGNSLAFESDHFDVPRTMLIDRCNAKSIYV